MAQEAERHVQAVLAALTILEAFDRDQPLRIRDLHERTGLNRSRIIRFAGTLEAAGFLEYDDASSSYRLGLKLYSLGTLLSRRVSEMADFVRPALKRLALRSGNTAFYSVLQGIDRLVVAKEESDEGLRFIVKEGSRRPIVVGATGKVLLAHAPDELRAELMESLAPQVAPKDRPAWHDEIATIRAAGYAISHGEATAHGFAVSVPVRIARGGQTRFDALTIAGPLAKLTDTLATDYVEMLRAECGLLATTLVSLGSPHDD